jgi:uncharacterized protein
MAETEAQAKGRVVGFDVARSLALLGMIVVHFSLVAAADQGKPEWLAAVNRMLDGRAAATFVVLAGIGVTLMSRRAVASNNPAALAEVKTILVRRGLFLLAIGFINLAIWAGDILRVYGVSLLIASRLLQASGRRLLAWAAVFVAVFAALLLTGDFEKNWQWETMSYKNLWTPVGILRNLFYDGFRSVFPWSGFLIYGMWLGRHDLTNPRIARRTIVIAVLTAAAAEGLSHILVSTLSARPNADREEIQFLFGVESMPALPLFVFAAVGTATAAIAMCVRLCSAWPGWWWYPLAATGQMALTWYFGHIVIGLGAIVALNMESKETLPTAVGLGIGFFIGAVCLSALWKLIARHGPMEWVMRHVAA